MVRRHGSQAGKDRQDRQQGLLTAIPRYHVTGQSFGSISSPSHYLLYNYHDKVNTICEEFRAISTTTLMNYSKDLAVLCSSSLIN